MNHRSRPLLDLLVGIVVPSIVLMKLSDDQALGAAGALIVALAFPLGLGLYDSIRSRTTNLFAAVGLVSVLLTGGIGLLELDTRWLAVKEAAIPALLGIAVLGATRLGYSPIRLLLYNPTILDTEKIGRILRERDRLAAFESRLRNAGYWLGGTFFFSAAMNYLLATWIVTSPTGSAAFNEELGRLTLLSYPVIALPSLAMMLVIFHSLWRSIHRSTGLRFDEILAPSLADDARTKSG